MGTPGERLAYNRRRNSIYRPYAARLPPANLAAAACRAMNRWSAEFAKADPARLKPCMLLPLHEPERALSEFRYATRTLGLEVIFAAPMPAPERRWSDPSLDSFWREVEDS